MSKHYSPWKSRKFIITTATLAVVLTGEFYRAGFAKDCEILIPTILGCYHWANNQAKKCNPLGDNNGGN